jgi:hypothetical protein
MADQAEHFTAWITNDTSCLEGPDVDVVVIPDKIGWHEGDGDGEPTVPQWQSDGGPVFSAVTSIDAREGDLGEAAREAEQLLGAAGWRRVEDWNVVPTGYVAAVERD